LNLEYPLALLIIPIYFILKKLFPPQWDCILFPNAEFFKSKKSQIIEILTITLLSLSLANPFSKKTIQLPKKGYDILMALDTSGSMDDKIKIAKKIIIDFAKKRKNDRLGLVVFGSRPYIASPLTYEKEYFKDIVKNIFVTIAGGKTAIYDALFLSASLFSNSSKNKILILLTDGKDNKSITPLPLTIQRLKALNIKVYAIGIGDSDNKVLQKIAKETNGKFFHIQNPKNLKKIYNYINSLEKNHYKTPKITIIKSYYQYPLLIALGLYLILLYNLRKRSFA
jgi:Ca-activated chloride channel family protein